MKFHKEGKQIIINTLCVALLVAGASWVLLPCLLAAIISVAALLCTMFVARFFRVPKRSLLQDENIVFAPADGEVVVVEEVEETEYLKGRFIQVSVFMSIHNVHINWFPVGGTVEYFKHHHGKFLVAWHPKSSEHNERTTTVVNTGTRKILFRQIAGFVARRIVSYAVVGKETRQNSEAGFIKFGSRVDVLLPLDADVFVKLGDKVVGSQTHIARFK